MQTPLPITRVKASYGELFARLTVCALIVAALFFVAANAWGSPRDVVLAAMRSRPVYKEDVDLVAEKQAQQSELCQAIRRESKRQRIATELDWAALMIAIGEHESNFSLRIHQGFCYAGECDGGRARGPWQLHRYGIAKEHWHDMHGLDSVAIQAHAASRALERGYGVCRGPATDWLIATINGFAGVRCDKMWRGLEERIATWRKVRGAMR